MENRQIIGAGIIGLMVLLMALFIFQSNKSPDQTDMGLLNLDFSKKGAVNVPVIKELSAQEIKVGTGSAVVKEGDTIVVNYIGALTDGKKFDSSYDRKQPFTVEVGKGSTIKGFEKGVIGMKVGGKRRILIPSDLGYGSSGQGPIPPNASLIFDVELLDIKNNAIPPSETVPADNGNPVPAQENPVNNPNPVQNMNPTPASETPLITPTVTPTETPSPSITP